MMICDGGKGQKRRRLRMMVVDSTRRPAGGTGSALGTLDDESESRVGSVMAAPQQ